MHVSTSVLWINQLNCCDSKFPTSFSVSQPLWDVTDKWHGGFSVGLLGNPNEEETARHLTNSNGKRHEGESWKVSSNRQVQLLICFFFCWILFFGFKTELWQPKILYAKTDRMKFHFCGDVAWITWMIDPQNKMPGYFTVIFWFAFWCLHPMHWLLKQALYQGSVSEKFGVMVGDRLTSPEFLS